MILVDTSVWIDHLHAGGEHLSVTLDAGLVLMHPMVLGESACGNLRNRGAVLELLHNLPAAPQATDAEVLALVSAARAWDAVSGTSTCTCSPRPPSPARRGCGRATSALRRSPRSWHWRSTNPAGRARYVTGL